MNWKPLVTERRYNRGVLPAPANTAQATLKRERKREKMGERARLVAAPPSLVFMCFVIRFILLLLLQHEKKFLLLNIFSPIYLKAQHLRRDQSLFCENSILVIEDSNQL